MSCSGIHIHFDAFCRSLSQSILDIPLFMKREDCIFYLNLKLIRFLSRDQVLNLIFQAQAMQ